jgi:two-component system cell cycle sensor histidine kinase/response regulator CckA
LDFEIYREIFFHSHEKICLETRQKRKCEMTQTSSFRRQRLFFIILILAIFSAGLFFTWWMVAHADRELRADLLQQTQLVTQAMDIDRIKALSGTEADLEKPEYRRITEQVKAACSINKGWRWLYLMGRRSDGAVFFYLDSEPASSKDRVLPGQVYEEASKSFCRVFETGLPIVDGPYKDRWGMWISALVPVTDPQTGAVLAVLGTDIDARSWKWTVAARAALPVGLMLVLLCGAGAVLFAATRVDISPKPIMQRLLPPLAVMVILLISGAGVLLSQQHCKLLDGEIAADISDLSGDLRTALEQQSASLAATVQLIAADANVQKCLREGDSDRLLTDWRLQFDKLSQETRLSHFYFIDAKRICLLRVHKPEQRGDLISRFTLLEAERTGKTASGIELGLRGTFTLRVVRPVFEGGTLAGYVELGEDLEDVLKTLHPRDSIQMVMVIRKKLLNRQAWENSMRLLGREADWTLMPDDVVLYYSHGRLPGVFASWANQAVLGEHGQADREISFDGKAWRISALPLPDASGKEVGDLLIMRDISGEKTAFARLLTFWGIAGAVLLTLLLLFVYVLLRRTDAGILAQQLVLRKSEAKHKLLFDSAGDAIFILDVKGRIMAVNSTACERLGYTRAELISMTIGQVDLPKEISYASERVARLAGSGHLIFETGYRRKDGSLIPTEVNARILIWDGQPAIMTICRDITERKEAETALRESQNRFAQLAKQSATLVWEVDAQGLYTYVSEVAEAVLGYRPDEVVGRMHFYDVFPESKRHELKAAAFAVFGRKESFQNFVNAVQTKDGRQLWISTNGLPIMNADGTLWGYQGSDTDITERKLAEDALIQQKNLLSSIIESSSEAIFAKDTAGRYKAINDAGACMLGYKASDVLGRTDRELVSAETAVEFRKTDEAVLSGGQAYRREERAVIGGRMRVFLAHKTPWRDNSGKVIGVIGVSNDVTEHRQLEQAAQENAKRFSALVAQSPLSIQILDASGKTIQVNRAFEELWGVSFEQMRDYNILEDRQFKDLGLASYLKKAFSGDATDFPPAEFTPISGSVVGHKRMVQSIAYPLKDESGLVREVTLIHRDISERRKAEETLIKNEKQYRSLIEATHTGFLILDRGGRVLDANAEYVHLSGHHGLSEILGRCVLEWTAAHSCEKNNLAVARCMRDGIIQGLELDYKGADGRITPVEIYATVEGAGDDLRIMSLCRDITGRKLAEEERSRLESQLRQSQKMEAVGQLAGGVSHDFNNLLSVISGYSQILLMNPALSDDIRQKIEAIDQSGERAASLIRQLLMFSRRQVLEPKIINLDTVISGIEKMLRRLIKADIIMTRSIGTVLWRIKADLGSIEQVIMNLVINACDAMPDGGTLTVETGNVEIDGSNSLCHHSDIKPGCYVMLSVSDTGCGMDANVKEHIFEPFFTTKEEGKGTGLGLATVYGIVKQSNAHIDVQSELGKGTRFRIYFPQALNECIADEGQEEASLPRGSETILLVEDEDSMRNMLQDFLQSIGYAVLPACNGKEGLELAKNQKGQIHILLTDIVMPKMNGFELARQIKDSFPEIKLLFMSGHAKPTDTRKMMKINNNLIDKPINLYSLATKLREVLGPYYSKA